MTWKSAGRFHRQMPQGILANVWFGLANSRIVCWKAEHARRHVDFRSRGLTLAWDEGRLGLFG